MYSPTRSSTVNTALVWLSMPRLTLLTASASRNAGRPRQRPMAHSSAMRARNTGVTRTMIWLPDMGTIVGRSHVRREEGNP